MFRKELFIRILAASMAAAVMAGPSASVFAADTETVQEEDKEEKKQEEAEGQPEEQEGAGQQAGAEEVPQEGSTQAPGEAAPAEEPAPAAGTETQQEPEKDPADDTDMAGSMAEALNQQRTMVADDDIMMIRIGYRFSDGSFDEWARGTGFVVGNRYIITRQVLVDLSTQNSLYQKMLKERGEAYNRIGVNLANEAETQKSMRFYITDIEGNDIPVYDVTAKNGLGLVTTREIMSMPAVVFANPKTADLGDGAVVNAKSVGDADDRCVVNTFQGRIVIREDQTSGYSFKPQGETTGNPIGAPVYDGKGHILGMVSGDGEVLSCFTIKSIETFLTTNGVSYRTIEQIEQEGDRYDQQTSEHDVTQAENAVSDKKALEEAIEAAQAVKPEDFTEESYAAMKEALEEAIRVDENMESTQQQVDEAQEKLTAAYGALESSGFFKGLARKYGKGLFLIPAFIAVVLGVIILGLKVIPALLSKADGKKGTADPHAEAEEDDGSVYADDSGIDITYRPEGQKKRRPEDYDTGVEYMEEEEDSDLLDDDDGSDDTTLLQHEVYLVREIEGVEKHIPITKNGFVIGKEHKSVDYWIAGNSTVSRQHCMFYCINGEYYVEDNKSANETYLNDKPLKPYVKALIKDGDVIRLSKFPSDVEFTFHVK